MQSPPKLPIRWGAFFHDLGKPFSYAKEGGKVSFHLHEQKSAHIFKSFSKRVPGLFDKPLFYKVYKLIYNLDYIESYDSSWSDSAVRRFAKETGDNLEDLFELSLADITTANPNKRNKCISSSNELRKRILQIQKADEENKSNLPKGIGLEISNVFGIPLSPKIGHIKDYLENKIKENILLPMESVSYYIEYLKSDYSWRCLDGDVL
jgi:poly(A) polymerase